MANYIYTNGCLYNTDELQHAFKYIKKKRVNGKWRYYYDIKDALGYDERSAAGDAVRAYDRAIQNAKGYQKLRTTPGQEKWYDIEKDARLVQEASDAGKRARAAVEKYSKTPLGKLDKLGSKIDAGRAMVSNWLKRMANKIAPKTKSITKYGTGTMYTKK
jgi:hypothetical protein